MHRDIKPGNFLVDSNCQVTLCDFGLSRVAPPKTEVLKQIDHHQDHEYKKLQTVQSASYKKRAMQYKGSISKLLSDTRK